LLKMLNLQAAVFCVKNKLFATIQSIDPRINTSSVIFIMRFIFNLQKRGYIFLKTYNFQ
jgi:hypothetical protein